MYVMSFPQICTLGEPCSDFLLLSNVPEGICFNEFNYGLVNPL